MSAHVISMIGLKGGVGRTVVGVMLATALARRQLSVVVIDAHSQGGAFWMSQLTPRVTGIFLGMRNIDGSRRDLATTVKEHSSCDVIIIDTPSNRDDPVNQQAAEVAHLVLAPMTLGPSEVWAASVVVDLVKRVRKEKNPGLLFAGVVNKSNRTRIAAACLKKLEEIDGLPFLNARLTDRQAYRDAASIMLLRDKVAVGETDALADEVLELLASRNDTRPAERMRARR